MKKIKFEGVDYVEVKRDMQFGDMVLSKKKHGEFVKKNHIYLVNHIDDRGEFGHLNPLNPKSVSFFFYQHGRTREDFVVYERADKKFDKDLDLMLEYQKRIVQYKREMEELENKIKELKKNKIGRFF